MGHPSPSHQWDMHRCSLFRPTLPWAKEDGINLKVLHRDLLLCRHDGWARAWVEVKAMAHKPGLQEPRGLSTPSHLKLSL